MVDCFKLLAENIVNEYHSYQFSADIDELCDSLLAIDDNTLGIIMKFSCISSKSKNDTLYYKRCNTSSGYINGANSIVWHQMQLDIGNNDINEFIINVIPGKIIAIIKQNTIIWKAKYCNNRWKTNQLDNKISFTIEVIA